MRSSKTVFILGAAAAFGLLGAMLLLALDGSEAKAASCARGTKPAVVGGNFKCLRPGQSCSTRHQVSYRRYGFHCASGRLRRGTGLPAKPITSPATPPPPTSSESNDFYGHYKGVTSQNETFEFDVETPGGLYLRNLKTGQINQGCTPQFHLYGGNLTLAYPGGVLSKAGDFTIDTPLSYGESNWSSNWTGHLTIHGHLSGSVGSGSLEVKTSFVANGVAYTCGSGLQTWTVTRTG